jgi:hypothetical protein
MHPDWWVLFGLQNPCVVEEGRLGVYWLKTILTFGHFEGDFISNSNELHH